MTPSMEIARILGRIRGLIDAIETDAAEQRKIDVEWTIRELRDLEPELDRIIEACRTLQTERVLARGIQRHLLK